MANLRETRRKLTAAIAVLLCLDAVAGLLLIFPIGGSTKMRRERANQLRAEWQAKNKEVQPLQGIDKKVEEAKSDIAKFYDERLPAQYSVVTETLGKLAAASHVRIAGVKYDAEEASVPGLRRVQIEAALEGDYLQEVKFINALERSKLFFVVNSVTLGEQQAGRVRLQVKFETYLKTGA
jgi:hypothetical protein